MGLRRVRNEIVERENKKRNCRERVKILIVPNNVLRIFVYFCGNI